MTCADCGHEVKRQYPLTGPIEFMEEESWEHAATCPAVMRGVTDETGPWDEPTRRQFASDAERKSYTRRLAAHRQETRNR